MEELTTDFLLAKYREASSSIDETALQGIYAIDWQTLEDAYGPANNVPALLRAILSEDEDHRSFAFKLLHETIWHQGTIYEATSYAVPFLQKMLLSPHTPDKAMVAFLITSLATGYSENTEWVTKTRDGVGKDLPLLYPFLDHEDETFRYSVIQTLGYYPQSAKDTIPLLKKTVLFEKSEDCKKEIEKTIKKLQLP